MSRPNLGIGTYGTIAFLAQVRDEDGRWVTAPEGARAQRWRARTRYRDEDGKRRDVERFGTTKGKAESKLKAALKDRQAPARAGNWSADMKLIDAGERWLEDCVRNHSPEPLAPRTVYQYERSWENHFPEGTLAGLTLREANSVQVIERFLRSVANESGTAASKTAKSVLSGIIKEAVRVGVLSSNAVLSVRPQRRQDAPESVRDTQRALTVDERERFLSVLAKDETAKHLDVVDIGYFMAGTGCRINEAINQRIEDLDLDAGTVHIRGTKSDHSDRVLYLPEWLAERLSTRVQDLGEVGYLFPSPRLTERKHDRPRDKRNVARQLRRVLDEADLEWATPHSLRRTVATMIDKAGLPISLAADVLGHADAGFTASVYLGRRGSTEAAAKVL